MEESEMNEVIIYTDSKLYNGAHMELDLTARKILGVMLRLMGTDTNLVSMNTKKIAIVSKDTGYSESTIRKALVRLNKCGLAEKTDKRGKYIVNPTFATKGDTNNAHYMYEKIEIKLRTLKETR